MRVLLIADDVTAARAIALVLKSGGAAVDTADTDEEALELVRHCDSDIVVLDLLLPDMEGYDVVRGMRASRIEVRVLILSGLSPPQAKVKGLGAGADDFITRPFDKAELLARMQAVVRRSKGFSQPVLTASMQQRIRNSGPLDRQKRNGPHHHLYGGMDEPEMKIIDVFIYKLRKKLTAAGADGLIGTV